MGCELFQDWIDSQIAQGCSALHFDWPGGRSSVEAEKLQLCGLSLGGLIFGGKGQFIGQKIIMRGDEDLDSRGRQRQKRRGPTW